MSNPTERVRLTESSQALELLFRYVYGDVNINLDACEFVAVYELAEAAQKYIVFAAIPVCRQYLRCAMCCLGRVDVNIRQAPL